ncbi:hypothetical protein OP10G_4803 [Fimbriimonas ginsengisoli Gsoil 348]|uniref:Magnetosome protein MamS/MamX domain-containing protein n=1 Tax=Fimbriimonas ginsengisoli Gsoil 348 TaxID=661478 RepID=A0A068NXK6_FIMGI|nr:hypothetical protein OP10G_4803 [Fimbriimonas ginsengisoli Gsoil 348]
MTGLSYGQAVVLTGSGGYGWDSPYNKLYNRNRQVMFTGKVTGKLKAPPMTGMAEGVSLLVKTPKSGTIQVEVGPSWFVASQVAKINVGDKVRVIGSRATVNGDSVVLARQIVNTKTTRVLTLRDMNGAPYWSANRGAVVAQVPTNAIGGTILSSNTFNINGTDLVGYVVQTPDGNVNVVTAPQWYMDRQDYVLQPGAYVQVVGTRTPYQAGAYVTVADSLYTGNNTFIFRNDGVPIWGGWGGR